MSSKKPENLIISPEIVRAYNAWKNRLSETQIESRVPTLNLTVLCNLIAEGKCVNDELCGGCPAAKESFVWMRNKMVKDGVVAPQKGIGVPYEENEVGGLLIMSDSIAGRIGVSVLSIWDGYAEGRESEQTCVSLSIG